MLDYDIFAISKVLLTVPKIRLSCIFCTMFPVIRSEDRGQYAFRVNGGRCLIFRLSILMGDGGAL